MHSVVLGTPKDYALGLVHLEQLKCLMWSPTQSQRLVGTPHLSYAEVVHWGQREFAM